MKNGIWLLLGLVLGIAIGTGYAWVIRPADFRGAEPASLRPVYRGEYILLIASAFEAGGNLERARTRLALFPELNPDSMAELAQQVVAAQGPTNAARGLARLSVALREQTPSAFASGLTVTPGPTATPRYTGTPEPTLALTVPALPTSTRRPDATSSPTTIPEFTLVSKEQLCNAEIGKPLVQALVKSADGKGVPGVEIRIQWDGGQGRFLTGMKPELSPGYADYAVEAGKTYQVSIGDGLTVVRDLVAPVCPGGGSTFAGSWRLVFAMR
jgi:hypothetical protein